MPGRRDRQGFTLMEIIIAMAVVALLAGAVTPLVFKEIQRAREDATLAELEAIKAGLEQFFTDTGRFPSEVEGLTALAADPGVAGWAGPYVGGGHSDPAAEVLGDAFGGGYVYDLAPSTNPAGAADALVASAGSDQQLTFGSLGGVWTLDAAGDDLLMLVSAGSLNRDKTLTTTVRLEALGEAARAFFRDHAAFPAGLNDLRDDYLDSGIGDSALRDGWNLGFLLISDGATPETLTIYSRGPNQADDSGTGDDLALSISSIPPGRQTTLERLEIAQAVLNTDPGLALTGNWPTDLAALGLSPALASDGWGQPLQINVSSRVVYSAGPDRNAATLADNLPRGVGP